jgi:hypothetical protein
MSNNDSLTERRGPRPRRMLVTALFVLSTAAVAACTPHTVAAKHPCPDLSVRGAIALAKLGLTPEELKLQEKCR